jgi:hypothetical protein
MFQLQRQMNNIEETQGMSKSHIVCLKKNEPLFLNLISFLFLIHFQ